MTSKKLTIFEGPDGGGKTTIAKEYAAQTGARYVHFPALPRVNQSLGRLYVEAMTPALLGYQDVVMDRSWLSETPYGEVFREGRDRLTQASRRMLERLAFRCGGVVVNCLPGASVALANFEARKASELLKTRFQHHAVYSLYERMLSELPVAVYDYTRSVGESKAGAAQLLARNLEPLRSPRHPLDLQSAGAWDANVLIVGEGFAERKEWDSWYQWPFGSFSGEGCSKWLTDQLHAAKVREMGLLWINADQPLDMIDALPRTVIALGNEAAEACYRAKIEARVVAHPQYWKRFCANQRYRLIDVLEKLSD